MSATLTVVIIVGLLLAAVVLNRIVTAVENIRVEKHRSANPFSDGALARELSDTQMRIRDDGNGGVAKIVRRQNRGDGDAK